MRHGKKVIDHGRYQLDFRHPKVRAYATEIIDRLVEDYGVGYFKIDYNTDGGVGTEVNSDSFGDGLLGHNRAYLEWLREVKEKHPSLVLECCSSGGMRMDYAMLSEGHLQSVSDQTNYLQNALIAALAPTAVLPEQGAIWAYPKKEVDNDVVVVNMVNAMLQRIHLSGKLTEQTEEGFGLIREAIACYKSIRGEIAESIPFYPMGRPVYGDGWACLAFRTPTAIRMGVWRLHGEDDTVVIPLAKAGKTLSVLYPSTFDGVAERVEEGVRVTLPRNSTAVLLECK
jgi:alpha-galactosidase